MTWDQVQALALCSLWLGYGAIGWVIGEGIVCAAKWARGRGRDARA